MDCHDISEAILRVASNRFGKWHLVGWSFHRMCRFSVLVPRSDLGQSEQSYRGAIEEPVPMLMSVGIRVFCIRSNVVISDEK